ncbi:MAG TPA: metallophosphoesterase [Symbiobacteriaceae bacterium]
MRNRLPIIGLVAVVFGAINYYIGLRGRQWLQVVAPGRLSGWLYWIPFWIISCAFLVARFAGERLPRFAANWLSRLGAYWLLVVMYVLPLLFVVDVLRLLAGWAGWAGAFAPPVVALFGTTVLALLGIAAIYGVWRARTPVVSRHEVTIPKSGGKHEALHVVLVSDTHLGTINGTRRLQALVDMVNGLEPDLLLLAGDVMDDDCGPFFTLDMPSRLKQLQPKLGTYAVLGNHEYLAGHLDEYRRQMARAGIPVLVDDWIKVDDSFYVVGRDDISGKGFAGRSRKPLADVLAGVDRSLPLFLMDHQPYRLEEAAQAGIDLQVSGHTHRGQMFPNHLITRRVFELDWGYLQKGALHVIVSLGFGTWGPPVRIGNRPEVVSIRVRFAGK